MVNQYGVHFEKMYEIYDRLVYHYLLKRTHDYQIAEDIEQETFLKFYRSFDRIVSEKHAKYYLMRHAQYCLVDYYRKNETLNLCGEVPEDAAIMEFEQECVDALAYESLEEFILNKIRNKNPRWYDIVMAELYGHMTMEEIQEKYHMNSHTLSNHRYRLHMWMREQKDVLEQQYINARKRKII